MDTSGPVLDTARLMLRPMTVDDALDFIDLHAHPEVTQFIEPFDAQRADERLRKNEQEWRTRGHGLFAVTRKRDLTFIGRSGLKYWPQFDEVELGWVLRRDAWGRGYATEAASAVLDWGFEALSVPYITAMIHPDNDASIAVARRLMMQPMRDDALLSQPVVVYVRHRPCSRDAVLNHPKTKRSGRKCTGASGEASAQDCRA